MEAPTQIRSTALGRTLAATATLVALALGAAACSSTDSGGGTQEAAPPEAGTTIPGVELRNVVAPTGDVVDGGKLVMGLEAETEGGFNPILGRFAGSGHYVASAVFDPLSTIDAGGRPVPYLAESFEPNDDYTRWTIKLRDGVKYHDGTTMKAADVKAVIDGHKASPVTAGAVAPIDTVTVVDDLTIRVDLSQPWTQFPYLFSTQVGYIPAPSMLADPEGASKPVGTGPFAFKEWRPNVSWEGLRFADYWQPGKPHLGSIEFKPMPDAAERANALLDGGVDMMVTLTPRDIQLLRAEPDIQMLEYSNGEEVSVVLNSSQPPFDNTNARLAMAYATDVDRFLTETGRDVAPAARGPFAPGQLGYRSDSTYPTFDLDKAKQAVADYTAETGQPLAFTYTGAENVDDLAAQQLLTEMWEAAGMQVEVQAMPQTNQVINAVLGNFQAIDWRNFGAPDPDGDYVWWHSSSIGAPGAISLNVPKIADPELDAALDAARASDDPTERDQLYATVAERLNADVGYLWLERALWALAANNRVHGFEAAANGSVSTLGAKTWLADLWIEP